MFMIRFENPSQDGTTMPKYTRTVNKNLLSSLIKFNGYSLTAIGKMLDPPLTVSVVSRICNPGHPHKPEKRILEIAKIFHVPDAILFPYVEVQDSGSESQEKSKHIGDR